MNWHSRWRRGFEGQADLLILRPSVCDQHLAIRDARRLTPTDLFGTSFLPSGSELSIRPHYGAGFRFGAAILFHCRRYDLTATYTGRFTRQWHHVIPQGTEGIWPLIGHPRYLTERLNNASLTGDPTLPGALDAHGDGKMGMGYNAVDGVIGVRGRCGHCLGLRTFIGIRWAKIHLNSVATFRGTAASLSNGGIGFNAQRHDHQQASDTWGLGPRVGTDLRWGLICGFGLVAQGGASLLAGGVCSHLKERHRITILQGAGTEIDESLDLRMGGHYEVISQIEGRLGVSWYRAFGDTFYLDARLCWEATCYVNALRQVWFDDVAGTQQMTCEDFRLNGVVLSARVGV